MDQAKKLGNTGQRAVLGCGCQPSLGGDLPLSLQGQLTKVPVVVQAPCWTLGILQGAWRCHGPMGVHSPEGWPLWPLTLDPWPC